MGFVEWTILLVLLLFLILGSGVWIALALGAIGFVAMKILVGGAGRARRCRPRCGNR